MKTAFCHCKLPKPSMHPLREGKSRIEPCTAHVSTLDPTTWSRNNQFSDPLNFREYATLNVMVPACYANVIALGQTAQFSLSLGLAQISDFAKT